MEIVKEFIVYMNKNFSRIVLTENGEYFLHKAPIGWGKIKESDFIKLKSETEKVFGKEYYRHL